MRVATAIVGLVLVTALVGPSLVAPLGCAPEPRAPDIVIFVADDLGWNDVGYHGSEIRTPEIDALAASGVRLDRFYVHSLCSATRASLLTGRYPMRQGLQQGVVRPWATHGLPTDERTLPEALRDVGYQTALLGKWHLGVAREDLLPTRRGFDHHYGHYIGAIDYFSHRLYGGLDWHRNEEPIEEEGYTTELLADEALRWLRSRDRARPSLLVVSFNAPHAPLQAPDAALERFAEIVDPRRRTYAAMVGAMDDAVGRIVGELRSNGRPEDTLVVFLSDNGAELRASGDNRPLRGGKATAYEGGIRVPAIASWPGRLPAGSQVSDTIHAIDLYPTLLALAGAPTDQPLPPDGHDVWPQLRGDPGPPREPLLLELRRERAAVRSGAWKLIVLGEGQPDESVELYDVLEDPSEQRNRAAEQPERVRALRERLDAFASEAARGRYTSSTPPPGFRPPSVWSPAGLAAVALRPDAPAATDSTVGAPR